jgi:nucleoside-diphosphate-sugar epimerase
MKKIIVTGSGGYVGVLMCEALLQKGYYVKALDRYFFGKDKLDSIINHQNLEVIMDDIRSVMPSIFEGVHAVIDLAGLSNDASAEIDVNLTKNINYKGTERFIKLAKDFGVSRYIYASSASVYGAGEKFSLNESDALNPQTEYAKSKVAIERILLDMADSYFSPTLLRNATIFGLAPRMRFDLAINIMTMRAWKERVIYIMGGGEQWRPFVHVRDVVDAFLLVLESKKSLVDKEIFNVGSSSLNFQIKQLAQFIVDHIPNVEIHSIPDNPDTRTYNLNFDKIQDVLGFCVKYNVTDGIKEVKKALESGLLNPDDPTCYTLQWYKSLIEWDVRLKSLSIDGQII